MECTAWFSADEARSDAGTTGDEDTILEGMEDSLERLHGILDLAIIFRRGDLRDPLANRTS
jgi:hypothetical protein